MQAEKEFDLIQFTRFLDRENISYLLIGRWAVILHGAPLMTADFDFWVHPENKKKLLRLLADHGYEVPPESSWKQPLLSIYAGADKIDLFFVKKMTNLEGEQLVFEHCLKRSDLKEDQRRRITLRIPSINDLIALKKMPRRSRSEKLKDSTDIRFLQAIKRGEHLSDA